MNKAEAHSHTHSQFAPANATPKIVKEYVFCQLIQSEEEWRKKWLQKVEGLGEQNK